MNNCLTPSGHGCWLVSGLQGIIFWKIRLKSEFPTEPTLPAFEHEQEWNLGQKDTEAEKYPSSTQAAQNAVLPTAWAESEKQLMKSADELETNIPTAWEVLAQGHLPWKAVERMWKMKQHRAEKMRVSLMARDEQICWRAWNKQGEEVKTWSQPNPAEISNSSTC